MRILLIQGPNLNRLGKREPSLYGTLTLDALHERLTALSMQLGADLDVFVSNHEGDIIDRLHLAADAGVQFVILNAGGLSHTSVVLRDALLAVALPFIEVHITNIYAREPFRRTSLLSDIALGCITGLGVMGYELALLKAISYLKQEPICFNMSGKPWTLEKSKN